MDKSDVVHYDGQRETHGSFESADCARMLAPVSAHIERRDSHAARRVRYEDEYESLHFGHETYIYPDYADEWANK